jgi:hypothetical protein
LTGSGKVDASRAERLTSISGIAGAPAKNFGGVIHYQRSRARWRYAALLARQLSACYCARMMTDGTTDAPALVDLGGVIVVHGEWYQVTSVRTQDDPLTPGAQNVIIDGVRLPKPSSQT